MKVAVVGSRNLMINNLYPYIPKECAEIISGGAKGIDSCAKAFALENNIPLREFYPEYDKYGRVAPILRNKEIVNYSDFVIAFWDGKSKGTAFVIDYCKKISKPYKIFFINKSLT